MSGEENVDVDVEGNSDLVDGVYSVPASKGEAVKAVVQNKDVLKNVKAENVDVTDDDTVLENISSLRRDNNTYSLPEKSTRDDQDKVVNVTVSPDEYRDMVDKKVQALIDKYVPEEMRDASAAALIEAVMKGMGVSNGSGLNINGAQTQKTVDEQLDEIVDSIHSIYTSPNRDGYTGSLDAHFQLIDIVDDIRERLSNGFYAKDKNKNNEKRLRNVVNAIDTIRAAVPGSPEHDKLKNDVALGFLHVLAATDETVSEHPHMKGVIAPTLENWRHRSQDAHAAAALVPDSENRLVARTSYGEFALSSIIESLISLPNSYEGSLGRFVVEVQLFSEKESGYTIATHENTHARHFTAIARRLGIETGSDAEPILAQLMNSGKLQNTVFGVLFAFRTNKLTSEEIDLGENNKYMQSYTGIAVSTVGNHIRSARKKTNQADEDPRDILKNLFGDSEAGIGGVVEVLAEAIGLRENEYSIGEVYQVSDEISHPAATRKFVEDTLGMSPEDFVRQLNESLTSDLGGLSADSIGSNGMSEEEIFAVLGSASGYANTDIAEAIAESSTLLRLIDSVKNVNLYGNEEKIQRMRDTIARLFAGENEPVSGLKKTSERTIQLLSLYNRLVDAVRALDWDY